MGPNQTKTEKNHSPRIGLLVLLLAAMCSTATGWSQATNTTVGLVTESGDYIVISNSLGAACSSATPTYYAQGYPAGSDQVYPPPVIYYANQAQLNSAFALPPRQYYTAQAGVPCQLTLFIQQANYNFALSAFSSQSTNQTELVFAGDTPALQNVYTNTIFPGTNFVLKLTVTFPLGSLQSYVALFIQDYPYNTVGGYYPYTATYPPTSEVIIPFVVLGGVSTNVPVLGVTTRPQLPYLVLHAPPRGPEQQHVSSRHDLLAPDRE